MRNQCEQCRAHGSIVSATVLRRCHIEHGNRTFVLVFHCGTAIEGSLVMAQCRAVLATRQCGARALVGLVCLLVAAIRRGLGRRRTCTAGQCRQHHGHHPIPMLAHGIHSGIALSGAACTAPSALSSSTGFSRLPCGSMFLTGHARFTPPTISSVSCTTDSVL